MFLPFTAAVHESRHDLAAAVQTARAGGAQRLRFGRCEVRPAAREVLVDGQQRRLQPRPFDVLVYLIDHRERVLSIDELLDAVWGRRVVQPSTLTVAINRIRSVLEDRSGEIIRTHHRVGYRFAAALEAEPEARPHRAIPS